LCTCQCLPVCLCVCARADVGVIAIVHVIMRPPNVCVNVLIGRLYPCARMSARAHARRTGDTINLACPGSTIAAVVFADYGTPTGAANYSNRPAPYQSFHFASRICSSFNAQSASDGCHVAVGVRHVQVAVCFRRLASCSGSATCASQLSTVDLLCPVCRGYGGRSCSLAGQLRQDHISERRAILIRKVTL
jgi:hypothetical protein